MGDPLLNQIEELFLKTQFDKTLIICAHELNLLPSLIKEEEEEEKKTSKITLSDSVEDTAIPGSDESICSNTSRETQLMVVLIQTLYELGRKEEIPNIVTTFYDKIGNFPFDVLYLCVSLQVSQQNYKAAKDMINQYLKDNTSSVSRKGKEIGYRGTLTKRQYSTLVETLVIHVLLPLEEYSQALLYLKNKAALSLSPTVVESLKNKVRKQIEDTKEKNIKKNNKSIKDNEDIRKHSTRNILNGNNVVITPEEGTSTTIPTIIEHGSIIESKEYSLFSWISSSISSSIFSSTWFQLPSEVGKKSLEILYFWVPQLRGRIIKVLLSSMGVLFVIVFIQTILLNNKQKSGWNRLLNSLRVHFSDAFKMGMNFNQGDFSQPARLRGSTVRSSVPRRSR